MIDYDPHRWTHHLFDVRGSMVRVLSGRVLMVLGVAVLAGLLNQQVKIALPPTVHSLVGMALGLLLVFRTNASYDRFWEGRKLWGGIVNETRNLARLSRVHVAPGAPEIHASVVKWTIAFAWSAMLALRGEKGIGPAGRMFTEADASPVVSAQHVPLAAAGQVSSLLRQARDRGVVSDFVMLSVDQNVQLLVDYLGGCERIHKTPLPFAYVVHLRRALLLYCLSLPFVLVELFGWWVIPGTLLLSFIFFGIEEIGVEIEDPFGTDDNDLPLDRICTTIENNLLALLPDGERPSPQPVLPARPDDTVGVPPG